MANTIYPTLTQAEYLALDYKYRILASSVYYVGTHSAYFCYTPTISGTWPNITVSYKFQIVLYVGDNGNASITRPHLTQLRDADTDVRLLTWSLAKDDVVAFQNQGKTGYNYWPIPPLSGTFTKSFTSSSTDLSVNITWYSGYYDSSGRYQPTTISITLPASNVTASITRPSMTLSASNVTAASTTINVKSHTNPSSYWRYKAQWKLSTSTTWLSGSVFTQTTSTWSRSITDLTPGATYNYRFAYIDRDGNIAAYSSTLTFTVPLDQATIYLNYGGTVKKAKIWYNNNGTIKKVKKVYFNNSGTIKTIK